MKNPLLRFYFVLAVTLFVVVAARECVLYSGVQTWSAECPEADELRNLASQFRDADDRSEKGRELWAAISHREPGYTALYEMHQISREELLADLRSCADYDEAKLNTPGRRFISTVAGALLSPWLRILIVVAGGGLLVAGTALARELPDIHSRIAVQALAGGCLGLTLLSLVS